MPMPLAIPLIMTILGSGIQSREVKKASRRGMAERRKGREGQKEITERRRSEVLEALEKYDPGKRQERMETAASETQGRLESLLAETAADTMPKSVGKISKKVLAERAQNTRDRANEASILAALMSKVRAPRDVASEEALARMGLGSDIQGLEGESRRLARTTDILSNLESQPNARRMMAGGALQGAGMSLASGQILSALGVPGTKPIPEGAMSVNPNYVSPYAKLLEGIK